MFGSALERMHFPNDRMYVAAFFEDPPLSLKYDRVCMRSTTKSNRISLCAICLVVFISSSHSAINSWSNLQQFRVCQQGRAWLPDTSLE